MRHFKKLWTVLVALPLVWFASVGGATAATTLTGTITGTVIDQGGNALPGVTVILQSEALIRERAFVTDAEGKFFAPGLAPGAYNVTARFPGFQPMRQSTEVLLDETTTLSFILVEGDLTETVTVVATKPVVDKSSTEGAVSLNKDFTEQLPLGRSYQNLLSVAPGVVANQDGNPNMLGGTQNANTYQMDGVNITDPVTGTFGSNINYDVIEAVDIKLTGVSAEYGNFQGGLTNVITKSGGNDFTGTLRDTITSPSFEAAYTSSGLNEFAPEREAPCEDPSDPNCFSYTRPAIPATEAKALANEVQGTFGGPIVRDHAWFFVSYTRNDNVGVGRLESGVTYPDTFQGDNSSIKLTWQATNDHKVQYSYFEDPADTSRCYSGLFLNGDDASGCWDLAFVDYQKQGGYSWNASWDGLWGNNFFTNVKATHWQNGFNIGPYPGSEPFFNTDLIFESPGGLGSGVDAGNAPFWDFTTGTGFDARVFSADPETRKRDQYEAKGTMFFTTESLGTHTLSVGVDYQEQTSIGSSIISGNALYFGLGWVTPPQEGGDPYDPDNRIWYYWYDFEVPGTGTNQTKQTALYVQDDWQLNDKLTMNLGLRFEKNDNTNDVGEKIISQTGFAPRLGAAYDVTGEGKHVVKATASRYLDSIELTTLDFFTRAAGGQTAYDTYYNTNLVPGRPAIPGPGETCEDYPDQPCWALDQSIRPDPETNMFSEDLKPQYIDELTLSYEYAFSPTLGLSARAIRRDWGDIVGRTLGFIYDAGDDGIPGTGDDATPRNTLFLDNRDYIKREYNAIQIQAQKRFSNNWSLLANYTRQEAKGTDGSRSTDQGFADFGLYPGVPQTTSNRYGVLPWSVKNIVNVWGSYQVPLNSSRHALTLGSIFAYVSGAPYSAVDQSQYFVVNTGTDLVQDAPLGTAAYALYDPDGTPDSGDEFVPATVDQVAQVNVYDGERGRFEQPSRWRLDLSAIWRFNFSKRTLFETRLEVFNVTNQQSPVTINTSYYLNPATRSQGLSNYVFGYPNSFGSLQNARNYRVIFALVF